MKHTLLLTLTVWAIMLTITVAQPAQKVSLKLKNNSLLPREFKFLERHPADKYPNVFTAYIQPGQSYAVKLKVGTSLALVNQSEIDATMRGQDVPGRPLLTVMADDEGKTINLIP